MNLDRATILTEGWLSAEALQKELTRRGVKVTLRTLRRYNELRLIQGTFGPPQEVSSKAKYRLYYPPTAVQKVIEVRRKLERGFRLEDLSRKQMTADRALAALVEWRDRAEPGYRQLKLIMEEEEKRTGLPLLEAWEILVDSQPSVLSHQQRQLYIAYE